MAKGDRATPEHAPQHVPATQPWPYKLTGFSTASLLKPKQAPASWDSISGKTVFHKKRTVITPHHHVHVLPLIVSHLFV